MHYSPSGLPITWITKQEPQTGLIHFTAWEKISASVFPAGRFGSMSSPIPRLTSRLSTAELVRNRGVPLMSYNHSAKNSLATSQMKSIGEVVRSLQLPIICKLNTVWHVMNYREICPSRPNWSGFMQVSCTGEHFPPREIHILPIINLSPSDYTCIYSTLHFIQQQATQLNVPTPCVAVDQPLWLKAIDIVKSSQLKLVVRLGGFIFS